MLPLGTPAAAFSLPDTEGQTVCLEDYAQSRALLVMFICNHCPYVIHVADELARLGDDYQSQDISIVAIMSNDVTAHPDDSPAKMKQEKQTRGYRFAYLYDKSQAVAKAYTAACTPDFFLFDAERKLVYRGQLDNTRPNHGIPAHGKDLRAAIDAVLAGKQTSSTQLPATGCNIKWQQGNEPKSR